MITFLLTVVMFAIAGFVVGVGVLLTRDYPKVGEFIKNRPVLGWTSAFVLGGVATFTILYLFQIAAVAVIGLFLR